ncbi:uncharacterized protein LOC110273528 [Arachis duranensis]|uniref:Uncharacterized protein LOC110273528 n=1 Tax=Arachis duranensis TaxID=130453 RepID=A0A6P5MCZ4_ARADU|nr:uncharacterized protein LOC110273528 [Arachis duranensis]XP_025607735.1 rRNA 2'-O-methyltransferase fibrillarin-like [Arachis hypogaea]
MNLGGGGVGGGGEGGGGGGRGGGGDGGGGGGDTGGLQSSSGGEEISGSGSGGGVEGGGGGKRGKRGGNWSPPLHEVPQGHDPHLMNPVSGGGWEITEEENEKMKHKRSSIIVGETIVLVHGIIGIWIV